MNFVIITQIRNQGLRIYDWIEYHKIMGFDTFIIFDDFSDDDTIDELHRAKVSFSNLKIYDFGTDGFGNKYDSVNSEIYGYDKTLHDRLNRSYTKANDFVKKINPDAVCAIIDVDEFLASDGNLIENIKNAFKKNECQQISVQNFDINHDYILEKGFLTKNNFKSWDRELTSKHPIWGNRCKSIFISKFLEVCNYVHVPIPNCKTYYCREYDKLRMYHFRIPNLIQGDQINFVVDDYFKKFNKQFEI